MNPDAGLHFKKTNNTSPIMKLTKSILIASSIVTLASVPSALAGGGKGEAATAVEEATEAPVDDVIVEDEVVADEGEMIEDTVTEDGDGATEPEIVICDRGKHVESDTEVVSEGEPTELVDPAVCEMTGNPEVQRDGDKGLENPDVIFQNTAVELRNTGSLVSKAEAGFASDERAASIDTKSAATSQVKKEKKGPVALIKKGRVFLR